MFAWLKSNLLAGFKTSPVHRAGMSLVLAGIFACLAVLVGCSGDLFRLQIVESKLLYILPVSLFLFPAVLEEAFFRGILIPNKIKEQGTKAVCAATLRSALLFTAWHPLNALTINPGAKQFFLNPYFLCIVFWLGITCSLAYIFSRSLWAPILIHWLTVLIWVVFLGGRNLIVT